MQIDDLSRLIAFNRHPHAQGMRVSKHTYNEMRKRPNDWSYKDEKYQFMELFVFLDLLVADDVVIWTDTEGLKVGLQSAGKKKRYRSDGSQFGCVGAHQVPHEIDHESFSTTDAERDAPQT